jgi:hypothetical protein
VCTGLLTGSAGNEKVGKGATLSRGVPTTLSLPSASTRVIVGRAGGGLGGRSTSRLNMAKVSRTIGTGDVAAGCGAFTMGSRERVFTMTLSFDFARSSSGSKCSAPGAPAVALAFSRDTVRKWLFGMSTTSTAVGRRTENFLSSCDGVGPGDGVVSLLTVGDGVVSSG